MSEQATAFRPFARMGWSGRGHWRGLVQGDPRGGSVRCAINRGQIGTLQFRSPGGLANFRLSGVTRDSVGTVLGNCRVELFVTALNQATAETVSDISGNFAFDMPGTGPFYLVAYKPGAPDLAGTTVNTLMPVAV